MTQQCKPIIIGIAGGTASGKSTIARHLADALAPARVLIIGMDRYFKRPLPKCRAPFSGKEFDDFNQPGSVDIERLVNDLSTYLSGPDMVAPDVIIVEGLFTLQDDILREMLDLKVFVDCDADERIVRRLRRNMAERGLSFEEIAEYYTESVKFQHAEFVEPSKWHADIILNGRATSRQAIEVLVSWVRAHLRRNL